MNQRSFEERIRTRLEEPHICESNTEEYYGHNIVPCLIGKTLKVDGREYTIQNMSYDYTDPKSELKLHYELKATFYNELIPNFQDKVVAKDTFMSKYMKTLGIKKATYNIEGDEKSVLVFKHFASYKDDLAIVIDRSRAHWPLYEGKVYYKDWMSEIIPEIETQVHYGGKRRRKNDTSQNIEVWVNMMEPMIQQYVKAIEDKVLIPQNGNGYLFAAEGSRHSVNREPSFFLMKTDYHMEIGENFDYIYPFRCNPKEFEDYITTPSVLEQISFKQPITSLVDLKRKADWSRAWTSMIKPNDDWEFIKIVAKRSKDRLLQLLKEKNIEPLRCTTSDPKKYYPARLDQIGKKGDDAVKLLN